VPAQPSKVESHHRLQASVRRGRLGFSSLASGRVPAGLSSAATPRASRHAWAQTAVEAPTASPTITPVPKAVLVSAAKTRTMTHSPSL
jgi:hypothetical protein